MKHFREIEKLSAYLDGQLNESEAAQVEARLQSDPELDSILNNLRATRSLLRKLPARKAPRNFTLTRKMVGLKPPLPRTYPLLRLATTFAALLFLLSFSVNALSPYVSFSAPAPAFGFGGGGGSDAAAQEAPASEESSMLDIAPAATELPAEATEETERIMEVTPEGEIAPKDVQPESTAQNLPEELIQPQPQNEAPIPIVWVAAFFVVSLLSGLVMWLMRQAAASKWR